MDRLSGIPMYIKDKDNITVIDEICQYASSKLHAENMINILINDALINGIAQNNIEQFMKAYNSMEAVIESANNGINHLNDGLREGVFESINDRLYFDK